MCGKNIRHGGESRTNWKLGNGVWWYNVLWGIKRWKIFLKCVELIFLF